MYFYMFFFCTCFFHTRCLSLIVAGRRHKVKVELESGGGDFDSNQRSWFISHADWPDFDVIKQLPQQSTKGAFQLLQSEPESSSVLSKTLFKKKKNPVLPGIPFSRLPEPRYLYGTIVGDVTLSCNRIGSISALLPREPCTCCRRTWRADSSVDAPRAWTDAAWEVKIWLFLLCHCRVHIFSQLFPVCEASTWFGFHSSAEVQSYNFK